VDSVPFRVSVLCVCAQGWIQSLERGVHFVEKVEKKRRKAGWVKEAAISL